MLLPYIELLLVVKKDENCGIDGVVVGPCPHHRLSIVSIRIALLNNGINSFTYLKSSSIPFRNW